MLSTLLCSLVYGDLENSCFKHLSWDSRSLPTFYTYARYHHRSFAR